jgi:uncharacterized membrane protein YkoI
MKAVFSRRTLLLGFASIIASTGLAYGDDDDDDDDEDHNRASQAVGQGRALPLSEILQRVKARLGGEVIGVEFKRKGGLLLYKLKLVTAAGWLREVTVDARTGDIVESKGDD